MISNLKYKNKKKRGFTLVEVAVSIAIFAILSLSVFGLYAAIIKGIGGHRERVIISSLADSYMEIARNLPYSKVGTISGNPHGNLADSSNPEKIIFNGSDYEVYYAVTYIDDPADGKIIDGTDFSPNDYKQVKLYVKNVSTEGVNYFVTSISPEGLENLEEGGALFIKVFDAVGQPVRNAVVQIQNENILPAINVTRITDESGNWVEVGLPSSANSYSVKASKTGYSIDSTYAITVQNPNPVKPHATVLNGQVTSISFSIDKLSNLVFLTLDQSCSVIPGVNLKVSGSKLKGLPDLLKFNDVYISDGNGNVSLSNIEWDNYVPFPENPYMIYGSSPIQRVSLLPDTSQNFTLILGPATENSILVIVKDSSGNPVEGATVTLQKTFSSFDESKLTGGSVLSQQSWSGGAGQIDFEDGTKYYQDDGGVDVLATPEGLRLKKVGLNYVTQGTLTSSTFDTGTDSTAYTILTWWPASQDPLAGIKFQIAGNNDNETWEFIGPDGTAGSYYEVPATTINALDGNRYLRYKVFLSTADASKTPVLTSLNINYVSGCFSPGQVFFPGLEAGEYQLTVSMPGFRTENIGGLVVDGYKVSEILLSQ